MAKQNKIPKEIQDEVQKLAVEFNKAHTTAFKITFKGQFAYLSKTETTFLPDSFLDVFRKKSADENISQAFSTKETKLGRLKFNGAIDNWDFAVFRYSNESYDEHEMFFPGAEHLDGTVTGALKAGMEIY